MAGIASTTTHRPERDTAPATSAGLQPPPSIFSLRSSRQGVPPFQWCGRIVIVFEADAVPPVVFTVTVSLPLTFDLGLKLILMEVDHRPLAPALPVFRLAKSNFFPCFT